MGEHITCRPDFCTPHFYLSSDPLLPHWIMCPNNSQLGGTVPETWTADVVVMTLHSQHEGRRPESTTPKHISLAYFKLQRRRDGSESLLFHERSWCPQKKHICSYPRRVAPDLYDQRDFLFLTRQALLTWQVCLCPLQYASGLPDAPYPDSCLSSGCHVNSSHVTLLFKSPALCDCVQTSD